MDVTFPNIRHLRAFCEVARCKGVSAAADRIHLSQPAVTQAIGKLEDDLGIALFERRPDGMYLTVPGRMMFERVERALQHLSNGTEQACRVASRQSERGLAGFDSQVTASQLKALAAIDNARSFSVAARSLGISQPTIHRAARDLEKLSGLRLFRVTGRGLELTQPAELFTLHVKLASAELQQGRFEVSDYKGRDSTKITIGSMPLARPSILPTAIDSMLREKALIQILTVEGPYPELLRGLRLGEIDFLIGALRRPLPAEDVIQEKLFNAPLSVIVRKGHPLTGRERVSLEDTLDFPWIAPPKPTPAGTYLTEVLHIAEMKNTPVRAVSSSQVLVRGLLLLGDYVTILSRRQIELELEQGLLVALPVDLPDIDRPIGLTFRKSWTPTRTQARFLMLLRQACATEEAD